MKQVSLRQFSNQPSKWVKELPIILTKYNIPVAQVFSYKEYEGIKLQKEVNGLTTKYVVNDIKVGNFVVEPHMPTPALQPAVTPIVTAHCEAPNTSCKNEGQQYRIGFMTDEGVKKKDMYLCANHLQKARVECESVETV